MPPREVFTNPSREAALRGSLAGFDAPVEDLDALFALAALFDAGDPNVTEAMLDAAMLAITADA